MLYRELHAYCRLLTSVVDLIQKEIIINVYMDILLRYTTYIYAYARRRVTRAPKKELSV